ncbi:retropepsin-like aspartic protease family protein [Chromobacterium vaccinii]|uniref:retropepsin-like aspartic protease family protein n=1 Tax=Chromobacterium vaccinii TaxID=1108595 RepID=UPI003C75AD3C
MLTNTVFRKPFDSLHLITALAISIAVTTANAAPAMYGVFDGQQYSQDQLALAAKSPVSSELPRKLNGSYLVPRAPDGHYYLSVYVNGFPVVFTVDTGATFTAIPLSLSRNAGIRAGKQATASTANGNARMWVSAGNTLIVGGYEIRNTNVNILERLDRPLLGMDILNQFQVTYSKGYMALKPGQ